MTVTGAQQPALDGDGETSPDNAPPQAVALALAARFARSWARPSLPATTWWAALAPLCDPGFATALRTTEPANVPADRVIGAARVVRGVPPTLTIEVPTNGGTLELTVAALAGDWRVTGNAFRRS